MGIAHDLALLDLSVLLEHLGDLALGKVGVDASDEEVGAWVHGTIIIVVLRARATLCAIHWNSQSYKDSVCNSWVDKPVMVAAGGSRAAARLIIIVTRRTRRGTSVVAVVPGSLVWTKKSWSTNLSSIRGKNNNMGVLSSSRVVMKTPGRDLGGLTHLVDGCAGRL